MRFCWRLAAISPLTPPSAPEPHSPEATAPVAATAGKPIRKTFWCAGSWRALYPLSGHVNGTGGVSAMRACWPSVPSPNCIASLSAWSEIRTARGAVWKNRTQNQNPIVKQRISLIAVHYKIQYRFSSFWPVAQTHSTHVIGQSTLISGDRTKSSPASERTPSISSGDGTTAAIPSNHNTIEP